MKIVATRPVLYLARQYNTGDVLPVHDPKMVEAWLEAGSAVKKDEDAAPKAVTKAKPVTAQSGLPGLSSDGDEDALVGKITETAEREKAHKGKKA